MVWTVNESQQIQDPSQESFFLSLVYSHSLSYNDLHILYNQRARLSSPLIHHSTATNKRKSKASYSNQLLRIIAKISIFTGIFFFFWFFPQYSYSRLFPPFENKTKVLISNLKPTFILYETLDIHRLAKNVIRSRYYSISNKILYCIDSKEYFVQVYRWFTTQQYVDSPNSFLFWFCLDLWLMILTSRLGHFVRWSQFWKCRIKSIQFIVWGSALGSAYQDQ